MLSSSIEGNGPVKARWKVWARYVLAALAIGIAAASIAASLDERWNELALSEFVLSVRGGIILTAGVMGTLVLSAIYHTLLLSGFQSHDARPARVANAYALSQILRYVPGKVVGVVFQISMLQGKVRPASILSALIVHTAHDYAWTIAFCGVLLWAVLSGSMMPLLAFPPLLLVTYLVHKHRAGQRFLAALPVIGRHVPEVEDAPCAYRPALSALVLVLTWIPMLAGMWMAFAPLLGSEGSVVAGLLYLIAAVVSLAIIVVPSGLVVREAVFLWLGGLALLPAEKLLFMAIVVRIAMTLAEIATALLLAGIDAGASYRRKRRGSGN